MADPGPSEKPPSGAAPAAAAGPSASTAPLEKAPAAPRAIPPMLRPLKYMGIPETVLRWKPRLPSRNWMIFFTVTGSLTSMYYYDRKQCKLIRQEYVDKVQHLAEEPMHPMGHPRKVRVFSAITPGDDDPDKSLLYFKKYVKPILVAAAVDYETINGVRHGGIARIKREKVYSRRRQLLGLEPWGTPTSLNPDAKPDVTLTGELPFSLTPQQQLEHEMDGATVLVGRPAFKEWAWGFKAGWTTTLPASRQDLDEGLAKELSEDSTFDEIKNVDEGGVAASSSFNIDDDTPEADGAGAPLPSRIGPGSATFNPALQMKAGQIASSSAAAAASKNKSQVDPRLLEPPATIPAQPPLYFVDYTNLIGFKNVPRKIWGFFNERDRVRRGAQAGLAIALGNKKDAREFEIPALEEEEEELKGDKSTTVSSASSPTPPQGGDLDWGLTSESFYPKRFSKTLTEIEKARKSFYEGLPRRLQDTRSYVRGERELTASEKNDPPKTEGELRTERFEREKSWRSQEFAYQILKPESGVAWHKSFIGRVRVLREKKIEQEEMGGEFVSSRA